MERPAPLEPEMVQAIIHAFPEARSLRGPHGIPLLAHAQVGGEGAALVLEFLQELERV